MGGVVLYLQQCVDFFDTMFTHLVCRVTGKDFHGGNSMRLGGSQDLSALEKFGLQLGPFENKKLLEYNTPIWKNIPAKA